MTGRHRPRPGRVTVTELQARIADEVVPTGRRAAGWDIVWINGREYYVVGIDFVITEGTIR